MRTLFAILAAVAAVGAQPVPLVNRTLDVSGTSMHIRCGGERKPGEPLVVFEAGGGNSADTWRDVHEPIAAFARACAHDRPGRGASGPAPAGLDARGYLDLLRTLLRDAGEPPPYVFVGHSLGGLVGQLWAAAHPSELAGMVLVDSSHPDQVERLAALPRPPTPPAPAPASGLAPEAVSLQLLVDAMPAPRPAIDMPLEVLTRGRWTNGTDSPDDLARLEVWRALQRDLAARSPRGHQVMAAGSGHYIQNDEPALVVDAVRRVLAAK